MASSLTGFQGQHGMGNDSEVAVNVVGDGQALAAGLAMRDSTEMISGV